MANVFDYLVFFYWLSGAAITISLILTAEVLILRKDIKKIKIALEENAKDIKTIKKRLEKIKIGEIEREEIREFSSRVGKRKL